MLRARSFACLSVLAVVAACDASSTSSSTPPLTGVSIDASALFGPQGCGTADGQVFRYMVTVRDRLPGTASGDDGEGAATTAGERVLAIGEFDCFANATFLQLPVTEGQVPEYHLAVFGYQRSTYEAQRSSLQSALGRRDAEGEAALADAAQFLATCSATQRTNVPGPAHCQVSLRPEPIVPTDAGQDDAGDASADAGTGDAGEDAGDAGNGDAGDAGTQDASTGDAGDAGQDDAG